MTKVAPRVVPGGGQRRSEAAEVEVVRHIDGMRRLDDARRGEPAALLGLRRGMVELEEEQVRRRLEAVGEVSSPAPRTTICLTPAATAAFAASSAKRLRMAMKIRNGRCSGAAVRPRDRLLGFVAEDAKRQRIGEHETALEPLMRRPMPRRAEGGPARLTVLHCVAKVKEASSVCRERALADPANRGRAESRATAVFQELRHPFRDIATFATPNPT